MARTLDAMLERLGYACVSGRWRHPQGRTLISLGDLIDRGPDPLGCVERIAQLAADGCAHMVLGNHELNALHYVEGLRENSEKNRAQFETTLLQIEAAPPRWDRARAFIESQPTHMLLDEGRIRIVHAYWDDDAIRSLPVFLDDADKLRASAPGGALEQAFELCIKGPERRVPAYTDFGGHVRETERVPWWTAYGVDEPRVVFGHYWFPWPEHTPTQPEWTGPGRNAACLDFRAGRGGPLVALRHPEGEFVVVPNCDYHPST